MRWRRPRHGTLLPERFVPAAETAHLIDVLGAWVLEEACRRSALWRRAGAEHTMAVNLSPKQIADQDLLELITDVLERTAMAPEFLELEITESMLLDLHNPVVTDTLRRVSELGVRLAIDDFGRGCSSLAYLSRLPLHSIKIDRSFVANIGRDRSDEEIVKAVVGLGHSLGWRVVAEGVENAEQLEFLEHQGCDEAQGFHLGPPLLPAKAGGYLGR